MNVLVLGGTRFFGRHLVRQLLADGHAVTIATRGRTPDDFGDRVRRVTVDRTNADEMRKTFANAAFDVVCDNIAYCSNDVRNLLSVVSCGRYVLTSSASVYEERMDTPESDFDPTHGELIWGDRTAFSYDEGKRQAERAAFLAYPSLPTVAVRFPYVIGPDDYTRRLAFYVEHIAQGRPMFVDDWDSQLAFVRSDEAGAFLARLADADFVGPINGGSVGTISLREVATYLREKTGRDALQQPDGDPGPYNGGSSFSLDVARASERGLHFTPLRKWLFTLLDTLGENIP